MPSYKVHFVFECYPDTHWGEETEEEVIIEGIRSYADGDACFDSEGEESTISNWEDAVAVSYTHLTLPTNREV